MVLLIVDTQDKIVTEDLYLFDTFIKNISTLIALARQKNVELIYIRHDDGVELTHGAEGFEIFKRFAPKDSEKIFDKNFNSAFKDTELAAYLNEKNETQIMIVGLQTDYCIDATIKCGFEHGFEMIVPAFCNTTVHNDFMTAEQSYRYYNEMMWDMRYAKCVDFATALTML